MAAISLISSSSCSNILSFNPISSTTRNQIRKVSSTRVFASSRKGGDHADQYYQNYSSRLVDESMIVLRKRVHEMKMVERNYEPPSDWMDWEKRYYTTYDSFICQVMGFLQSHLMDTRPSFALAFLALIVLSVPTSTLMIFFQLLELAKGVGLH
ncbi:hypothetical protein ACFX2I_020531 [Malus domestica]|uniref:uncharacterized protein n=1 Tax=Malus domestica TaxID=3750 RepID=UPI0004988B73|nr:uncharacterized protein LOC103403218 [Malus domestica]XP_050131871.1 uncharacterized protein LOC126608127 [Malus sylvestris]